MTVKNLMQERQNQVTCDIQVEGVKSYKACLTGVVSLNSVWKDHCGTSQLNMLGYARRAPELQEQTFEQGLVATFLKLKFKLVRLVVEIHESEKTHGWGKCKWYSEHANYMKPLHEYAQECEFPPGLFHAMFRTELGEDKHFSLYSGDWHMDGAPLLSGSIVYHQVVFALPESMRHLDLNREVHFSPFEKRGMLDFPA